MKSTRKFVNVKTGEIATLTEGIDVFYSPYMGEIRSASGKLLGHGHQNAFFDKDGNEYVRHLVHKVSGSNLKIDYNK